MGGPGGSGTPKPSGSGTSAGSGTPKASSQDTATLAKVLHCLLFVTLLSKGFYFVLNNPYVIECKQPQAQSSPSGLNDLLGLQVQTAPTQQVPPPSANPWGNAASANSFNPFESSGKGSFGGGGGGGGGVVTLDPWSSTPSPQRTSAFLILCDIHCLPSLPPPLPAPSNLQLAAWLWTHSLISEGQILTQFLARIRFPHLLLFLYLRLLLQHPILGVSFSPPLLDPLLPSSNRPLLQSHSWPHLIQPAVCLACWIT